MKIITCENVSKSFHRHGGQVLLRQHMAYLFGRNRELDFQALKGVSFDVVDGEGLAVIGSNGAGKSTLLSIVAGLAKPDTGSVQVNGSIVDFAAIGDFIDEPLRTYSSGMWLRLAFSVAVNVDPEILIVDEVLAVGDQDFQTKCYDRIRGLRNAGKTFVCVSHSKPVLMELCDQAIWLAHGEMTMTGPIAGDFEA